MARRKPKKSKKGSKNKPLTQSGRRSEKGAAPSATAASTPDTVTVSAVSADDAPPSRSLSLPQRLWSHRRSIAWGAALGLAAFAFLVMKSFSLHPYVGDEYIYLYQSKLVSEGVAPYAEFAAAHPPFQMVFTALLFKLFGFNFLLFRMLPGLWYLAGGLALAWMVKRELGGVASIVAAAVFLFSHEPLRASSHYTGVNMTTALLAGAFLAYRYRAIRVAALISVCAVFTRLYAIPGVAALTLFALIAKPREGLRLVIWGAGFGVAAFLVVGLFTGFGDMVHNLLLYHAQKTPMKPGELIGIKDKILFHNATPTLLFALAVPTALAALVRSHDARKSTEGLLRRLREAVIDTRLALPLLATLAAVFYLVVLLFMDRVWMYYFIPPIALSGVLSGWMVSAVVGGASELVRSRGRLADSGISRSQAVGGGLVALVFTIGFVLSPRLESRLAYWDKHMKKPLEERGKRYQVQPTILPDVVEAWARYFLWPEERVVGEPYNAFNFVLWHESRIFDIADELAETIRRETSEGGEIFGDSGSVPMLALLSGRRIAGNEVDTNYQRYRSGNADPNELISNIDNDKTEMIILREHFGVAGVVEVRRLVQTKYERVKSVRSHQGRVFHLFKRRTDAKESSI